MKKIISLLLTVVVAFSFASVTAFAADATSATIDVTFAADSVAPNTASTMSVKITFDGTYVACAVGLPFVAEGFTVDSIESILLDETPTSSYAINDGQLVWSDFNQTAEITTITINCAITTGAAGTGIITFDKYNGYLGDEGSVGDIYLSEVEDDTYTKTLTIKDSTPSVATVVPTEAVLTDVAQAQVEMGQAVAMTFAAKDLKSFADMSWEVAFETAGTKYAPVDYPAATISALGETAPVQFVAAFLVKANGGVLDPITSVAAGFCDGNKDLVAKTAAVLVE